MVKKIFSYFLILLLIVSCVKFPKRPSVIPPEELPPPTVQLEKPYIYPFDNESTNVSAEIIIQTDGSVNLNQVKTEIPFLKYNKSFLVLLTQDDCRQDAFSSTWAAINGKPQSFDYYYDFAHLRAGDLPPDCYCLGNTLGITDGAGNEVRFSFTTTLAPEYKWMNAEQSVNLGFKGNYFRFYMKSGLVWENVREMLNYGVGIAFHDANTEEVNNTDTLLKHFIASQKIIIDSLSGRGCKTLVEPNGNKTYVTAAQSYAPIQILTAQAEADILYPYRVGWDLNKMLVKRVFYEPEQFKLAVEDQLKLDKKDREAIHVGLHGTGSSWIDILLWLNYKYGKGGDNSVWVPNLEEYYEYNYYRVNGFVKKTINNNELKVTVNLPSDKYFYYPSVTINVNGLKKENITSISSSDQVTGLSYGNYDEGVMINIDCRKFLLQHATKFVERYEKNRVKSNYEDALYFVNMLKNSDNKQNLLERIK